MKQNKEPKGEELSILHSPLSTNHIYPIFDRMLAREDKNSY